MIMYLPYVFAWAEDKLIGYVGQEGMGVRSTSRLLSVISFLCRIRESFHITAWTQVDHVLPACLFRYYFFSLSRGTCFFAEIQFCKSLHDWPCRARAGGVGVHRKTPRLPGQPWLPIPDPFPLSPHRPVFLNNLELQFAK